MDCIYEMIVTEETDVWGNHYIGYGIAARTEDNGVRITLHRVPDLFMDQEHCEQFVHMCNAEQVASFHLLEVIDNVLAE